MTSACNSVTVIIPAYNASRYLAEAIECALTQTHPPHEVIVIDDGSKDDTPDVCKSYAGRIRYIRQENRGHAGARNTALDVAEGEFVALLDADDICAPERFARQIAALQANPEAIACFSGHWVFTDEITSASYAGRPENAKRAAADFACDLLVHPITMMFRRLAAERLRFPASMTTGPDMIFTALLRRRGSFVIIPDILYGYRRHSQQNTAHFSDLDSPRQRLQWLRQNAPAIWPDLNLAEVERTMWLSLAGALRRHYWARRGQEFRRLRDALRASWPAHLPRPPELALCWYPEWIWQLKGRLDSLTGRGRKAPALEAP